MIQAHIRRFCHSRAPYWLQCQIGPLPIPKRMIYQHGTPLNTIFFKQNNLLSIKKDQKLISLPQFCPAFLNALWNHHFWGIYLSGFLSKVNVQIGMINWIIMWQYTVMCHFVGNFSSFKAKWLLYHYYLHVLWKTLFIHLYTLRRVDNTICKWSTSS